MDITNIISLPDLAKLVSTKALNDTELKSELFPNGKIAQAFPMPIENLTFSLKAAGDFTIDLFNSPDDKDKDGILGISESSAIRATDALGFDKNAWLKYSAVAGIKANEGISLENIGCNIDISQEISLNLYKIHLNTDKVITAVAADIVDFATVLSKNELINNLKPGECATLKVNGGVGATLKIKWGDMFAFATGALAKTLNISKPIRLNFDASLSSTFKVSVTDDFLLVIYKKSDNEFVVKLKKTISKKFANNTGIGIKVSFENLKDVEKICNKFMESITGQDPEMIRSILSKAQITDEDKKPIVAFFNKLGIENSDKVIDPVAETVNFIAKSQGKIKELCNTKVETGFAFEYTRIKTDTSILEISLTKEGLNACHLDLVKFNTHAVIQKLSPPNNDIKLISYLNEQKLERNTSWGFGISIGKWFSIFGKDNNHEETIIEKDIAGKIKKVSFVGSRTYASKLGDIDNWGATFKAQMNKTTVNITPTMNEFDLGFHLFIEKTDKKPNETSISEFVDNAVLWGIISQNDAEATVNSIKMALGNVPEANYSVQMLTNDKITRTLITYFAQFNAKILSSALAASMPYVFNFNPRKTLVDRRNIYTNFWFTLLSAQAELEGLTTGLHDFISKNYQNDQMLANVEKEGSFAYTFKQQASTNLKSDFAAFNSGMKELFMAISNNKAYDENSFHKPYQSFKTFWTQSFYIRTLGYYILDIIKLQNLSDEGISKSFTVKYMANNVERVMVFGGKVQ